MKFIRWQLTIRIPGAKALRRFGLQVSPKGPRNFAGHSSRNWGCPVGPLLTAAAAEGRIRDDQQPLADRGLEALIGWTLNRGA